MFSGAVQIKYKVWLHIYKTLELQSTTDRSFHVTP